MLCGIWIALGTLASALWIRQSIVESIPDNWYVILFPISIGSLFALWLNGHRILIIGTSFLHRNGLYQTRKCDLSEISLVKVETVQFERFRRDLGIPKIVVHFHDKSISPILINPKSFSLDDLGTFWEIMEANGLCLVRKRAKSKGK